MNAHRKHELVIGALLFIIVFLAIALGFLFLGSKKTFTPTSTATTTPSVATFAPANPGSGHVIEHAAYYDIDLEYPTGNVLGSSVGSEANAEAIRTMKGFATQQADTFKEQGNFAHLNPGEVQTMGLDQNKEALTSTYEMFQGKHTVSYVFTIYQDTLGAHPNTYFRTFTFDTATGKSLELSDLFTSGSSYLHFLSSQARVDVPKIINAKSGTDMSDSEMVVDGTTPDEDNFQNFYFSGTSFVLLFPPYQVAPYAAGSITDPIPLSKLASILKPEYQ